MQITIYRPHFLNWIKENEKDYTPKPRPKFFNCDDTLDEVEKKYLADNPVQEDQETPAMISSKQISLEKRVAKLEKIVQKLSSKD